MSDAALQRIQQLQFSDPEEAAARLLPLLRDFVQLDIADVQVRPLAVSLNSINGTLTLADGQRLFFKTHVEPESAISEYYQAEALSQAGWPVVRPLHSSTAWGRQLLIYELVEDPTVFDLAWQIETGDRRHYETLRRAQHRSDDELLAHYLSIPGVAVGGGGGRSGGAPVVLAPSDRRQDGDLLWQERQV